MSAGHRILVVDDEPNIVDVVSMALRYRGLEVAPAATGQEAISQVTASARVSRPRACSRAAPPA
jgi:two-component system OmpR family response regulator